MTHWSRRAPSSPFEALAWLRAIGIALVHLGPDGAPLTRAVLFGYDGLPIRRAQAVTIATGLDVALARDLIAHKRDGQRANLVRLREDRRSEIAQDLRWTPTIR